jgi:putative transposase
MDGRGATGGERKNRILLENYYLPGQLEARIEAFVAHYNHLRYQDNLTPVDVYFGRGQTILLERERIKRKTIQHRCLHHKTHAALKSNRMRQNLP